MGRGDKKTAKGKRFKGSFGKTRPSKIKKAVVAVKEKINTTTTKKVKATKEK